MLAVIGEQIPVGNELCGIGNTFFISNKNSLNFNFDCKRFVFSTGKGVSLRYNEDILSIWNRNADDTEAKKVIYEAMSKALPIQSSSYTSVEYKV